MESQAIRIQAQEKLKVADHLISTTYSLVREPKLLVSVIENIYQAFKLTMHALLVYEKQFVTIPTYTNDFENILEIFKRKIVTKYDIPEELIEFILKLKKTVEEHKHSTVEFTKKEHYVISDNDYNITTLNIDDVKKTFIKAKKYIDELFKIIKVN